MRKPPFRTRFRLTVFCFIAPLIAPSFSRAQSDAAASTDKKKEVEPVQVRFICAVGVHPIKYKFDAAGIAHPYYDEGDIPPGQIFYKDGKDYKRVCLNENSAPGQCVVSADKHGILPTTFYTRKITAGTPAPDAKGKGKPSVEYTPLITVNGLGGPLKDALVCLYSPNLTGKWCPPKTTVLDASPAVVPPGSVLVVNLSAKTTAMQIGSAKPMVLKPGEHTSVAPGSQSDEKIIFKIAVVNTKGVFAKSGEYTYQSPAGSRQVLTLYSVDEKATQTGVDWFVGNL